MSDKVREQFEAFMAEGDRSGYSRESLAWVCWLASRAAALEEAAAVCEAEERRLESHGDGSGDAEECARLIRALAGRGA